MSDFSGKVTVSMDGLRKNLSRDVDNLRSVIIDVLNDDFDKGELVELMNQVIQDSNILNCIYRDDDDSFNDISDIEVEQIEVDY